MANYDDTATVSGSVVSIENGADDVWAKSCVVTVSPTLSGISSVTETQTGRNLIPFAVDYPNFTQTKNDMTISVLANGKVKFNGTTTASTDFTFYPASSPSEPHLFVKNGTYTFSNIGSASVKMVVSGGSNNGFPYREITNGSYTGSVTDETKPFNYIIFRIASGVQLDNVEIEPMLEYGSTAHAYEQYQTPTVYTASLGRTIYGGQVDIVNGKCEPTNYLDTSIAETKSNNSVSVICDGNGKYTATGMATGGSANITFTLKTPCEIKSGMYLHLMNSPANASVSLTIQKQDNTSIYSPTLSPANRIVDLSSYVGETIYSIRLYVVNNASSDVTFSPMLCYSSAVTPYSPYFDPFTFTGQEVPTRLGYNAFWSEQGNTELTYYKSGYGYTSVTVHKETPDGEPVEVTRKLHRIIYEGQVDVISGTGLIYRGESGTEYDPPETFTFPPISMETDDGENTLYAGEGDSAITYRKETE